VSFISFFVNVIRIFQDRLDIDPAHCAIIVLQLMEKTVVSAGVTRHTTDLLDLKQQYIIITIKANLMHFLEVTGLLTLVP
jgi:hypothetical protein